MSEESKTGSASVGRSNDPSELCIQFLYFATCPHAPQALTLLREVLRAEGLAPKVEMINIKNEAMAQQYTFYGSPTIRVNGEDVSPPDATSAPFFGCRLYPQPDGGFAAHPSADAITHALRQPHQRA